MLQMLQHLCKVVLIHCCCHLLLWQGAFAGRRQCPSLHSSTQDAFCWQPRSARFSSLLQRQRYSPQLNSTRRDLEADLAPARDDPRALQAMSIIGQALSDKGNVQIGVGNISADTIPTAPMTDLSTAEAYEYAGGTNLSVATNLARRAFSVDEKVSQDGKENAQADLAPSLDTHSLTDEDKQSSGLDMVIEACKRRMTLSMFFIMISMPLSICIIMQSMLALIKMLEEKIDHEQSSTHRSAQPLASQPETQSSCEVQCEPLAKEFVSEESACMLLLPCLKKVPLSESIGEYSVMLKTGHPIIKAKVQKKQERGHETCCITLVAAKSGSVLGICELKKVTQPGLGSYEAKCRIYQPSNRLFATVECTHSKVVGGVSKSAYKLQIAESGVCISIEGQVSQHQLSVKSQGQAQLAQVEAMEGVGAKEAPYYKVCVQPKVDTGVIILALLALDLFPSSRVWH